MTARRRPSVGTLRDFFALEHNILVLLGAILAIGMGEELWVRFIPKYLGLLGAGAVAIGKDRLDDLPVSGWLAR